MVGRNFEKVFFEVYLFNGKKSILTANYHLDSPILDIQTTMSEGLVTVCKLNYQQTTEAHLLLPHFLPQGHLVSQNWF